MYVPGHFAEASPARLEHLVDTHPLATLVVVADGGFVANHLPFLRLDRLAAGHRLVAHVARGNPLWRLAEAPVDALLVFSGAEAYVSPTYLPGKAEHHRVVPTYNYAAVHLHGRLRSSLDAAARRQAVEALTRHLEAGRADPWSVADAPPDYVARMLDGIVALEFEIRAVEAKFKASQNKPVADRRGIVAGLRADGGAPAAAAAADLVEASLPAAAPE